VLDIVQTPGVLERRLTVSPDVAVAVMATGVGENAWVATGVNAIVWPP
jgi:hypothetical protein